MVRPFVVHLISLDISQHRILGLNFRPHTTRTNGNIESFKIRNKG